VFGKYLAPSPEIYQVSRMYCPAVSFHNCELPPDTEESTGAAGSHSFVSAATTVHVATFDFGFILSSFDEEIEFNPDDSTAAMFM